MTIEELLQLVKPDMERVNTLIEKSLYSEVVLINQISHYIINSGGKRLRPMLVLLSAGAFGYNSREDKEKDITLAAVIEFIHTATLLHDDVVDDSALRRGKSTANELWGNAASVLVGDFLYSRAFEMMVSVNNMQVMDILSHATNTIAEGEVLQLLNCHDSSTSEGRYLEVIHCKTAKLFEAAARLGAVISGQSKAMELAMSRYGMHLGTAFQLIDDILDYTSDSEVLGKNIGDDLAEGKPTLPLIYAMNNGSEEQADLIRDAITHGGLDQLDEIVRAVRDTGALDYARKQAQQESELALACLDDLAPGPYRDALQTLTEFSINRSY